DLHNAADSPRIDASRPALAAGPPATSAGAQQGLPRDVRQHEHRERPHRQPVDARAFCAAAAFPTWQPAGKGTGNLLPVKATIDSLGRIVVPKPLRDALGLTAGSTVDISRYGAGLQLVPAGPPPPPATGAGHPAVPGRPPHIHPP